MIDIFERALRDLILSDSRDVQTALFALKEFDICEEQQSEIDILQIMFAKIDTDNLSEKNVENLNIIFGICQRIQERHNYNSIIVHNPQGLINYDKIKEPIERLHMYFAAISKAIIVESQKLIHQLQADKEKTKND